MKKIIAVAILVLTSAAVQAHDGCRQASEFAEAAAVGRDAGISQSESVSIMKRTTSVQEHALFATLIDMAYRSKRASPEELKRQFRDRCERTMRP